jgi:hypothetical protein
MVKRFGLSNYGPQLWTREKAKEIRSDLNSVLEDCQPGEVLIIDAKGVEVFDFSFANELFGKSILSLATEYPERFLAVENLSEYAKENLIKTLEGLNVAMLELGGNGYQIIGKLHPAYVATFQAVAASNRAMSANLVKDAFGINLTAANERLSKLVSLGLLRREKATSEAGREQFIYSAIR